MGHTFLKHNVAMLQNDDFAAICDAVGVLSIKPAEQTRCFLGQIINGLPLHSVVKMCLDDGTN